MTWAELTYRQQVNRLRRAALSGIEACGMHGRLEFVQHGENTTFRLRAADGDYLVRVHRTGYQSTRRIQSELVWLQAMRAAGLHVPAPTKFGEELVQLVDVEGEQPRRLTMLRWTPGRFRSRIGANTATEYGRVLGQMHRFVSTWERPSGFERARLDLDGMMGERPVMGGSFDLLPDAALPAFEDARAEVIRRVEPLGQGSDVLNLIHADLHYRNIVFTADGAVPIDFDDAGIGYFLYDLAVTITSFEYLKLGPAPRNQLLDEYQRHFETPAEQLAMIDTFRAARAICITLWVLGRHDHPGFRRRAPAQVARAVEAFDRLL